MKTHFSMLTAFFLIMPPVYSYEEITHRAMSNVAASNSVNLKWVFSIFNLRLESPIDNIPPPWPQTPFITRLEDGAEAEDSHYVFRYLNHFYDPINKSGLTDLSILPILPGPPKPTSCLEWAWDNTRAVFNPDHGWKHAREVYFQALTASAEPVFRHGLADTLYDLGHTIHLIQDMAQPQHTRNDAHSPPGPPTFGQDAPYEKYCGKNFQTPGQILALGTLPPHRHTKLPPAEVCDGKPPEFVAFWDTYQTSSGPHLAGPSLDPMALDPDTLGLAEFSNAFFVTDDTLFTGEPDSQTILFPAPLLGNPSGVLYRFLFDEFLCPPHLAGLIVHKVKNHHRFRFPQFRQLDQIAQVLTPFFDTEFGVKVLRVGQVIDEAQCDPQASIDLLSRGLALPLRGSGLGKCCVVQYDPERHQMSIGLNDRVYGSHARTLIRKAVSYSAGLLDYFFRGRLETDFSRGVEGLEVTNRSGEALREGSFSLYYWSFTGGPAEKVLGWTVQSSELYSGDFADGAKVTIKRPFPLSPPPEGNVPAILVFKGTLGNEKDIGVAFGIVPPWLIDG